MKVLWPNFEKRGGLVTVVAIDRETREVLMVAFANEQAFQRTIASGVAYYWSTSRNQLWMKGGTSGDFQLVSDVLVDCDGDALIYVVDQQGAGACHTKAKSCFFRSCFRGLVMDAPNASEKDILEERAVQDLSIHPKLIPVPAQETKAPRVDREQFKGFVHGMGMARPARPS